MLNAYVFIFILYAVGSSAKQILFGGKHKKRKKALGKKSQASFSVLGF